MVRKQVLARWLRQSPADIYLLDASASMEDEEDGTQASKWSRLLGYTFPEQADIYTFTTANEGLACAQRLQEQMVVGGNALYDSLAALITDPRTRGKTITVVTDGRDDTSTARPDDIAARATKQNIKINILTISASAETADEAEAAMQKFAETTGGAFYIRRGQCKCD